MGSAVGRPVKFTREVQQEIVRLISVGNYMEVACRAVGIAPSLVRNYRKAFVDGTLDPERAAEIGEFLTALDQASAYAEANAVEYLYHGGPGWQSKAWLISRRFHRRWGRLDEQKQAAPPAPTEIHVHYGDTNPPDAPDAPSGPGDDHQ